MKLGSLLIFSLLLAAGILTPAVADLRDLGVEPLQATVTGRPLGLGGAFVGLADDPQAALYNPAGLAWNKGVAISAQDGNNISVTQAYPSGNNYAFGFALLKSQLSKIIISPTEEANFFNTTAYLSYGAKLTFIPWLEQNVFFQRFALGFSVKGIVNQTLQRTGQTDRSATGWDVDLGMLWRPEDWWSVGATLQNALPKSSGAAIKWDIGSSEGIPLTTRLGGAVKVIGDIGAPIFSDGHEALFAGEADFTNQQSFCRLGGEYGYFKTIYARLGWQQANSLTGLTSDITYGLGYRNELWGCDLAGYREPTNNQRYVTFSLLYFPADWIILRSLDIERPQLMLEQPIEMISLQDNISTYDDKIEVSGRVKPGVSVYINGLPVDIGADDSFKTVIPLRLKKNLIMVEARYQGEKKSWKYKVFRKTRIYVPDAAQSKNVTEKKEKVENLMSLGVIEIKPDASFVMEAGITRGELVSWLVKSADFPLAAVSRDLFVDVPFDHPLAPFIKAAVDRNLIKPFADGTFRPNALVSKKDGDIIFAKFGTSNR